MKLFKRWGSAGVMLAVTALATTLIAGCGGDRSFPTADLRIIHAGSDAPLINVRANGTPLGMAQGLAFAKATALLPVRPDVYSMAVDGVLLDGSIDELLAPMDVLLNAGNNTTLVVMGKIDGGTFALKKVDTPRANIAADSSRIQLVHAATNTLGDVDVYVTAPGAALVTADATVAWGQASAAWTLAAGEYQIRATAAGTQTPVIFDSGPVDLLGGTDLMLVAVDNYGPSSALKLLVSSATGQGATIFDQRAVTELRLVQAAAGITAADVSASSAEFPAGGFVESNIGSRSTVEVKDLVAASDYIFTVNETGSADILRTTDALSLEADNYYTAVVAGDVPSPGNSELIFLLNKDDRRSVVGEARLRFIHAASQEEELVLFITKAGEKGLVPIEGGDVTPTVAAFKYQDMAPLQQRLSPGNYDIRVAKKALGTNKFVVLINNEAVSLLGGEVRTLVIAQPDPANTDFDFVQIDD